MLFDTKKLQPLYQLSVGQPGSSFTFEVAQFNGIPENLIEKAKQKVSLSKLQIDGLTVSLQQEKSKFKKINSEQYLANAKAKKTVSEFEEKLDKLAAKAEKQTQFFEQQNKFINTGRKVYELIKKHKHHKTNKILNEELIKFVAMEKTKVLESEKPVVFDKKLKLPDLPTIKKTPEQLEKIAEIQKEEALEKATKTFKVGDTIKLKNHSSKGTITEIKGDKLMVMVGNFMVTTTMGENQSESEIHKINKVLNKEPKKPATPAKEKETEKETEKPVVVETKAPEPAPALPKIKEPVAQPKVKGAIKKKEVVKPVPKKLQVGDTVKLKNQSTMGTIQEIKGSKIYVMLGNFMITTQLSEIEE
jgi:dsDNA-specific endonuclease/ATPase MutS2